MVFTTHLHFFAGKTKGWFMLHCIVTRIAFKMIWMVTQRRSFFSISTLRRHSNHFICTSSRNAMQRKSLHHIINQP